VGSPPVIEYDAEGNVVRAWGDQSKNPDGTNAVLPNGIHGCFVDYQDNVWIAGNGDGVVQKWTHDGQTMLLQIGTKGKCDWPAAHYACGNSAGDPAANRARRGAAKCPVAADGSGCRRVPHALGRRRASRSSPATLDRAPDRRRVVAERGAAAERP
jgi:hypothetical protein